MSSVNGTPKEGFDERLSVMRDGLLAPGENIICQQMGDPGQGIVVSDTQIMILKAGLAATGSITGKSVTTFRYDAISTINLRKGPMGAVLQIVGKIADPKSGIKPPENMLVFSGEAKVRRLDSFSKQMEAIVNIKVNRFDWTPSGGQPTAGKEENTEDIKDEVVNEETAVEKKVEIKEEAVEAAAPAKKPRAPRKRTAKKKEVEISTVEEPSVQESVEVPSVDVTPVIPEITYPEPAVESVQPQVNIEPEEPEVDAVSVQPEISVDPEPQIIEEKSEVKETEHHSLADELYAELMDHDYSDAFGKSEDDDAVTDEYKPFSSVDISIYPNASRPEIEEPPAAFSGYFESKEMPAEETEEPVPVESVNLNPEPSVHYNPNPKLKNYKRRRKGVSTGTVALVLLLCICVIGGIAVIQFGSAANNPQIQMVSLGYDKNGQKARLNEIRGYRSKIKSLIASSNVDAARLERAVRDRNPDLLRGKSLLNEHEKAVASINAINPPNGLRLVQQSLISGIIERKAVASSVSTAIANGSSVDPQSTLNRLKLANRRIVDSLGKISMLDRKVSALPARLGSLR